MQNTNTHNTYKRLRTIEQPLDYNSEALIVPSSVQNNCNYELGGHRRTMEQQIDYNHRSSMVPYDCNPHKRPRTMEQPLDYNSEALIVPSSVQNNCNYQLGGHPRTMEQQIDYNHQSSMVPYDYFNSFPLGYRFCPTDEELIVHYLNPKVLKQPLPRNMIPEVNLYAYNPETLAANYKKCGEDFWYFFTSRDKKYPNGKRPKRSAGDGFWKVTGTDTKITKEENGRTRTIGLRRSLVYYKGNHWRNVKTKWIMHEFCIPKDVQQAQLNVGSMLLDEWVLCRIYNKTGDENGLTGVNNGETQSPLAIISPPEVVQCETPTNNGNSETQTLSAITSPPEVAQSETPTNNGNGETQTPSAITSPPEVIRSETSTGNQLEAPENTVAPAFVEDGSFDDESYFEDFQDAFMDLGDFLDTT